MVYGYLFAIYGTMTEPSEWRINDISLPFGPEGLQRQGGCNKEVMNQTKEDPIQVVDSKKGEVITFSGTISDPTKTDTQLWTDVLAPIKDLEGTEIVLTCPILALCNNYLLESFDFRRDTSAPLYKYTLKLSRASLNIIMQEYD
jgi:hypothetical protein